METKRKLGLAFRRSPLGIGYELVDADDGYRRLFYTSDKNQLDRLEKHIESGGSVSNFKENPIHDFKPRMLALKEKHGTYYVLVQTEEQLFDAAIRIVRSRSKEGWYRQFTEDSKPLGFTVEDIERMPESLRNEAKRQLKDYEHGQRADRAMKRQSERLARALSGDARMAWIFLQNQGDAEYESVSLEDFTEAEKLGPIK